MNKKNGVIALLSCAVILTLSACSGSNMHYDQPLTKAPVNSLDWTGTYGGTLPCANCPGLDQTLTLHRDGRYELTRFYQGSPIKRAAPVMGTFTWDDDGERIQLDATGDNLWFLVTQRRIIQLDARGQRIDTEQAPLYVMSKTKE